MAFDESEQEPLHPVLSTPNGYSVPDDYASGVSEGKDQAQGFYSAAFYVDTLQNALESGTGVGLSMSSISPGGSYKFGDGTLTSPSISWINDPTDGFYRVGSHDEAYVVNSAKVTEWLATEFRVNYLTLGSVIFAGASGKLSQDNANFFWDDTNNRLGIGLTDPAYSVEVRNASLAQLALSTDDNNAVYFLANQFGLIVQNYTNGGVAPTYDFRGDNNNDHPILKIYNTHTTGATSHAWMIVEVGGASAGDPIVLWDVDFAQVWAAGIDNSDSDTWKVSKGATLGTNDYFKLDTSGNAYFSTGYTAGSVLFMGASGLISQNNASFFWDNALLILKSGVGAAHQWQGTSLPVSAYVSVASTVFSGTQDGILNFGWNINQTRQVGTEPSWYMALESNYNNGADTFCEWYIDFQTTGSVDYRPIGCVISRTTNVASVNVNASSFTWSNEASSTIYGSFTSASGVVFQNIAGTTAKCSIGTNNNVGFISLQDGSTAHIQFYNNGTNIIAGVSNVAMDFRTNNTLKWQIAAAGSLLAGTDNSWDIGASGATRPRSIYWGTQALASDGSVGSPAYSFAGATATGFYKTAASVIRYSANNSASVELGAGYLWVVSDTGIYYLGAGADTAMVRNAAGKVQIGSGTVGVNVGTNGTNCFAAPSAGQIAFATAAKGTTDTTGYFTIPSCAGAPTGVPANIPTGQIPMVYDSTNNFLYVYNGGWKKSTVYA